MSLDGGGNPDPKVPEMPDERPERPCPLCGEKVKILPAHIRGEHE